MIPRLKALNKGRARVWWLTHGAKCIRTLQLVFLVVAFLFVSTMDYRDQVEAERAAHATVTEELRQERAIRSVPRTAWIVDARTPQEASTRLADIAGDLDKWRYVHKYGMGGGK